MTLDELRDEAHRAACRFASLVVDLGALGSRAPDDLCLDVMALQASACHLAGNLYRLAVRIDEAIAHDEDPGERSRAFWQATALRARGLYDEHARAAEELEARTFLPS